MLKLTKQRDINEAEAKLVEALRSGKYRQGVGFLRPNVDTFCCLGVACDVLGQKEWIAGEHSSGFNFYYGDSYGVLPAEIVTQLNWSSPGGELIVSIYGCNSLIGLNDSLHIFAFIADVIEAGYVKQATTA